MSDGLLWVLAFVVLSVLFVGCGNEALKANVSIASAMLEVQSASGPVIRAARVEAGVSAGRDVHDSGGDEASAQLAASSAARRWQCAIDGHRIYASAVGAYIDTLALWAAGLDFELTDAIPFVRRALDTYRALVSCLVSLGSDALPAVPVFLDSIPPLWEVER